MRSSRILVVDDEPGMVRAVERVLGGVHRVVGTKSSSDALTTAAEFRPELAILDIRMPGLDGFELLSRLKADHPDLDVILMTGSVEDLDSKLIRAIRSRAFYFIQKPFDREVLETLVERCLELRWRREEHRRHLDRLEKELREAWAFQQSLLPPSEAVVNGLAIHCRYAPCARLGGDLYDYADVDASRTALLIADVSGHGVSAAMLTGIVKSAFHASSVDGYEPLQVVRRVSSGLATFSPERFVTMVAVLIEPSSGRLRYVNAGHPSAVVWGDSRDVVWLESTGPLVSPVLRNCEWDQRVVSMEEGDRLLLYTDGISDPLIEHDRPSEAAVKALVERHSDGGAPLLDALLAEVHHRTGGRQPDDLTLLTATVRGR